MRRSHIAISIAGQHESRPKFAAPAAGSRKQGVEGYTSLAVTVESGKCSGCNRGRLHCLVADLQMCLRQISFLIVVRTHSHEMAAIGRRICGSSSMKAGGTDSWRMRTHTYIRIHTYTYTHTGTHIHTCIHTNTHMHAYIHCRNNTYTALAGWLHS